MVDELGWTDRQRRNGAVRAYRPTFSATRTLFGVDLRNSGSLVGKVSERRTKRRHGTTGYIRIRCNLIRLTVTI